MGQHLACVMDQEAQDVVFARRQLHVLPPHPDNAPNQINRQVAAVE
jgi:hypothetical protein